MKPHARVMRRYWPTVAMLVGMTTLQVSVAGFSLYLLSGVRAYVTGESLYSKGQKDAQILLLDYAEFHREADYQALQRALAVPIADRIAREELQKPEPDLEIARQGFIGGGNHPDDITALIRLFRWFSRTPLMSEAIVTWTEGDGIIEQMRSLAESAHERVLAGDADSDALRQTRARAPELNQQLTLLESKFSAQLGETSRLTQRLLLALNGLLALILTLAGLAFVRKTALVQAQTEAEVVRRQESLQSLLDSAAEGLYGVDLAGRCTFANRAALKMLGYEREADLLGRPIHALIVATRDEAAAPQPNGAHSDAEAYRRRDGSEFPVERWSHPVMHDGAVNGLVTTFFDISERIRLRTAVRRGEIRMERLVDSVTDGVITFADDGRVVLFNSAAERLFQTAAASALGSAVHRFFAGELPRVAELADHQIATIHELTGKRAHDATTFPLEASFSRVATDDGVLNTVVVRDVTALHSARAERQAREALEASNRAKTEFLSRMSHELRTPLNAVIGFAQLLRIDSARPSAAQHLERISHIENAAGHLLALVNDVLDLSRVESGEMAVSSEAVDLARAVEEAGNMVSPLVTKAMVELLISPAGGAPAPAPARPGAATLRRRFSSQVSSQVWVAADPIRLRQVLVNLLSNAVKYNRHGGSVNVSWRVEDNGECLVWVADTGPGIAQDKLARLFEPFNRLGAETSKVEGTGIGLFLSRRLAEMMGGRLNIASTVGEGTVATLVLKLARRPLAVARAALAPSRAGAGGQLDVLYAEDNEVNAELVRQIVSLRPGVTLRVAESGTRAVAMAKERPPDLMLVDMNLGDMTGIELASALRAHPLTQEIRLFALSADALPEQIDAALKDGFRGYLTKPIEFAKLLSLFDDHLQAA
jgi:PAS domain S-box-containing protein